MYFFIFILLILCFVYVLKVRCSRLYKMVFKLPAGAVELPIVGSGFDYLRSPEDIMKRLIENSDNVTKLGGAARFYVFNFYYIGLTDATDIAVVLKTYLDKEYLYSFLQAISGNGSVTAPASIAKDRRKVLMPSFNPILLNSFIDIFWEESVRLTERLASHTGTGPFSVEEYLNEFNFSSILKTGRGIKDDDGSNKRDFLNNINKCTAIINERLICMWMHPNFIYKFSTKYSELKQCTKLLSHYAEKVMNYRRDELAGFKQSDDRKDSNEAKDTREGIFDALLKSKLNDAAITEEIVTMIGATDLSGISIGFTLMLLGQYPAVQEKVYEELQDVFANSDRPFMKDDLTKLNYLDMVIKESMRLYPPAPIITRKACKEITLPSGNIIPAGAGILVFIVGLHRNPKYWGPDAEHFDPNRFLPERFDKVPLNAYIPFSYGARKCIGYKYGQISMKTVLSTILRKYKIVGKSAPGPIPDIRTKFGIFMKAVNKFEIELVNRN